MGEDVERRFWTVGAQEIIPVVIPPDPPVDQQAIYNALALSAFTTALETLRYYKPNVGSPADARYADVINALEHGIAYLEKYVSPGV